MSTERPSILQVKNDVIRVALPYLANTAITYLTAAVAATGTTLTAKDNDGLPNADYLILGPVGGQQTEVVRIDGAPTYGTSITITATTFAHGIGTKVTLVRYDQLELYGSTTANDASPTLIGSAEALDFKHGFNEIEAGTTFAFYYARYKDSNGSTFSSYSDSAADSGLSSQSRGELKNEFLSIYNEQKDDLISDDFLNRSINRWQRELLKRRKNWSVLRALTLTDTVQDQQRYPAPTDILDDNTVESIMEIRFGDRGPLKPIDQRVFSAFTADHIGTEVATAITASDSSIVLDDTSDFTATGGVNIQGDAITVTANSESTATLTTSSVSSNHSVDDEVWHTYTTGQPSHFTLDKGEIKLYPIPGSAQAATNLHIEYWKKFPSLDDDQDETLFNHETNCFLYMNWQLAIRKKLPFREQQERHTAWRLDLEELVADDGQARDIWLEPNNLYFSPY